MLVASRTLVPFGQDYILIRAIHEEVGAGVVKPDQHAILSSQLRDLLEDGHDSLLKLIGR